MRPGQALAWNNRKLRFVPGLYCVVWPSAGRACWDRWSPVSPQPRRAPHQDWWSDESFFAALEERYPEPPLYPHDAAARQRALALDLDETLGPALRAAIVTPLFRNDPLIPSSGAIADIAGGRARANKRHLV